MIARPCATCGDLIPSSARCTTCRPTTPKPPGHVHRNDARWKNLSKKIRRASPFCEWCGAVDGLQADHIIPQSVAPELAYAEPNIRVLCATCNNRRQNTYTTTEAETVLKRLVSAYNRRPTRSGRERITVAENAIRDQGGHPQPEEDPPAGKAFSQLHTGGHLAGRT